MRASMVRGGGGPAAHRTRSLPRCSTWRSSIAPIGNPNAVSDAGVAAQLAAASVRGALLNVRINLPYLPAGEPLLDTAPGRDRHAWSGSG